MQLLRRTKIDTVPCQVAAGDDPRSRGRMNWTLTYRCGASARLAALWLACAMLTWSVDSCFAQCVEFSGRAPRAELDAFAKSPSSLLQKLRNDKDKLSSRLAAYIVSDPSVLPSVQTLISEAPSADRSAIGEALRMAEARCTLTKPDIAQKIRNFTQRLGDLAVKGGYSAASADDPGARPVSRDKQVGQPRGGGLLEGEGKTKLVDPFKPLPLPR